MAQAAPRRMTFAEYEAAERDAGHRLEFVDGRAVAMAGGTRDHATILSNLVIALGIALRDLWNKLDEYMSTPSVRQIVYIDSTRRRVHVHRREDDAWILRTWTAGAVQLQSLELDALYAATSLEHVA